MRTIRQHAKRWHQHALPTIGTQSFTSTWDDAVGAWDRIDQDYESDMGAIVQRARGNEPFWISCQQAAGIVTEKIAPTNKMTVSRKIKMLMADEVIDRLSVGSPDANKSSEYRYLYPLYE